MIDHMNRTMKKHIVTIEDPIEFLHRDRSSHHQPARGRAGHRVLQARPAARAAPGPGRDPGRRDARRGDRPHRAVRGRDRPPRALHAAHRRRAGDDQPHHRLLPAPSAAAGPRDDRRHAEGHRLPAPRPHRRRPGPRRDLRDPEDDRPRPRHDPGPEAHRSAPRGHRRGRLLRDADVRPAPAQAPARRPHHLRRGDDRGHLAARLQADGRGRGADRRGRRAAAEPALGQATVAPACPRARRRRARLRQASVSKYGYPPRARGATSLRLAPHADHARAVQ